MTLLEPMRGCADPGLTLTMERGRGQTRPGERRAAGAAFLGQAGAQELLMVTRLRLTFTFPMTQVKKTSSSVEFWILLPPRLPRDRDILFGLI